MSEQSASTAGVLKVGQWEDDGWVSPYLRLRFKAPSDDPVLVLTVFSPDSEPDQRHLAVRQDACRLLFERGLPAKGTLTLTETVTATRGAEVDISLRTDRPFDAGGNDVRELGVVVIDCQLVASKGSSTSDLKTIEAN